MHVSYFLNNIELRTLIRFRCFHLYIEELSSDFGCDDVHDRIFGTDKGYRKLKALKAAEAEHNYEYVEEKVAKTDWKGSKHASKEKWWECS